MEASLHIGARQDSDLRLQGLDGVSLAVCGDGGFGLGIEPDSGLELVSDGPMRLEVVSCSVRGASDEYYGGAYEVVPTREAQTLATRGCIMAEDVEVAPIPSNYGLVEWNGSALTVS